jgi:repressor LexA
MTTPFTARQGQYLSFIHGFIVKHGVAPSFEEIGVHFGTTPPSVNNMIKTLDERGFLSRVTRGRPVLARPRPCRGASQQRFRLPHTPSEAFAWRQRGRRGADGFRR